MACTVAVESVIVDHYNEQLRALMSDPAANRLVFFSARPSFIIIFFCF
jgi:Ubiquinone biosynthesis protein COQ7